MESTPHPGMDAIVIARHWARLALAVDTLSVILWLAALACLLATLYAIFATIASPPPDAWRASAKRSTSRRGRIGAVSVLKPLCGLEPRLYENLKTFCDQSFDAPLHLLFGVSRADDTAIETVRKLQSAYPHHDIELVIDARVHGSNLKVSNLINMEAHIRHPTVVLADSDIAVETDYLEQVTAPLTDTAVGIVTCLYRARSVSGFWSRVGALFINEWFAPSVGIAHVGGSRRFGFGATLALRRETLHALGGFAALKDCLADDYWLAEHTRALGLKTVLSPVTVATDVIEPDLRTLWAREMRWLRTIRSVNGRGFAFLFVTFTSPWLFLGAWLSNTSRTDALVFGTTYPGHPVLAATVAFITAAGSAARVLLHARSARPSRTFWRDLPLVPLRDMLLLMQWMCAIFGSSVIWRGAHMPAINRFSPMGETPQIPAAPLTPLPPVTASKQSSST